MENKEYGYGRVSATHQSTNRQIDALKQYGVNERDIVIDKVSGKDFNRKGYQTLKEQLLRSGDVLVVKELDRLGRNKQMIKEELQWMRQHGIRVKILDIPTTLIEVDGQDWILDMISNILIEVLASIAEEERLKNHQRQREGIDAAHARGQVFGRPQIEKPAEFDALMEEVEGGTIKAVEAMKQMGLKKSSYYKLRKMYEESKHGV